MCRRPPDLGEGTYSRTQPAINPRFIEYINGLYQVEGRPGISKTVAAFLFNSASNSQAAGDRFFHQLRGELLWIKTLLVSSKVRMIT